MKKRIIQMLVMVSACVMAAGCASYRIYSVDERPVLPTRGGMLYALPRTQVVVDVELTTFDQTDAPYAQYAAEMVGYDETAARYRASVKLSTVNVPDPRAYYYVEPRRIAVDINKDHLLCSVGMPIGASTISARNEVSVPGNEVRGYGVELGYNLYDRADTFYVKGDKPGRPSMVSSKPDVRTLRKRALAAAEELNDVQERLRQLERGDFDESYTLEQLGYVQSRLKQREEELLMLFVGVPQRKSFRTTYIPQDERTMIDTQSVVLFYYSPMGGIVDSAAAGSVPVVCQVRCDNQTRNAARFVKYRVDGRKGGKARRATFKYRLAERARVEVSCPYFSTSEVLPIVQFGPTVDLPKRRFQALFDPLTGDLLYYNGRP